MNRQMLRGSHLSVFEAKSREDVFCALKALAHEQGFQTFAASAVVDNGHGIPKFLTVDNAPAAYQEAYNDPGLGKIDPVMQHCKTSSTPIVWGQTTYQKAGRIEKWELQAQYGYRSGITLAMHLPGGTHFVLGVERDQDLPADAEEVRSVVTSLLWFAVHGQEACMRILLSQSIDGERRKLSSRELETLRWTLDGKTAWEVGRILGVAENTVIRHAHNATRKLECANKHHAAVKALRLGLIR